MVGASCLQNQINVNSASLKELDKIIWVGSATAQKIIDARPYKTIDDLTKAKGIGSAKLREIKKQRLACVEKYTPPTNENHIGVESISPKTRKHKIINVVDKKKKATPKVYNKEIIVVNNTPKIISLNERSNTELVFESKNSKVIKYLPYAFSIFSIFIIVVLAWERF